MQKIASCAITKLTKLSRGNAGLAVVLENWSNIVGHDLALCSIPSKLIVSNDITTLVVLMWNSCLTLDLYHSSAAEDVAKLLCKDKVSLIIKKI